jgi:hypothetical protein
MPNNLKPFNIPMQGVHMNRTGIRYLRPGMLGAALLVALPFVTGCSPSEKALTVFEDITAQSGLGAYEGMTHGAAWGDYDGDGQPDLYVTNHLKQAMLFRNMGGGRFTDVTVEVINPKNLGGDKHGAWADFNNDGKLIWSTDWRDPGVISNPNACSSTKAASWSSAQPSSASTIRRGAPACRYGWTSTRTASSICFRARKHASTI